MEPSFTILYFLAALAIVSYSIAGISTTLVSERIPIQEGDFHMLKQFFRGDKNVLPYSKSQIELISIKDSVVDSNITQHSWDVTYTSQGT